MIKFTNKLYLGCLMLLSSFAQATLITDSSLLTSDYYVTYSDENVIIDFAWASPVNVEYWGEPNLESTNRLFAPTLHQGWGYAEQSDLDILLANFTLEDFTMGEGDDRTFINAVQFWNTVFEDVVWRLDLDGNPENGYELIDWSNLTNYQDGLVRSQWSSSGIDGQGVGSTYFYDTFYVRKTILSSSTPVPEPSTLMIFALALIALALKSRFSN